MLDDKDSIQTLLSGTNVAIYVVYEGKICSPNPATQKMYGFSEGVLTSKPLSEFVHPEDRGLVEAHFKDRLAGKNVRSSTFRILDGNNNVRYVQVDTVPSSWNGQPAAYCIQTDITERKRTEEQLRDSEIRNRALLDGSPVCNKIIDLDSRLRYMSAAGVKDLKIPDIEPYYGSVYPPEFFPEPTKAMLTKHLDLAKAGETSSVESPAHDIEGNVVWFHTTFVPVFDDESHPKYVIVTSVNITERKISEERLQQSQKMEAMGQLTGGIAHDFNNLLAGAHLTKHLLAYSRKQSLNPKSVNVSDLMHEMQGLVSRTLGEKFTIRSEAAPDLWSAQIDSAQLENAILNLAINSRDAMPTGGEIFIQGNNIHVGDGPKYAHLGLIAGDYIALSVQDTGSGISDDQIDNVFEPFFTTKEVGKGSGLGLSMVYGFAKQSGGNAAIESEEGSGTKVTLHIPRTLETGEEAEIRTTPAQPSNGNGERILLVEDDPAVRSGMTLILSEMGYVVIDGGDGSDAVKIALDQKDGIDLLLTDVVLPNGQNGPDLADRITTACQNTKPGFPR